MSIWTELDKLAPLPRMVVEARKLLGTLETPGLLNNPTIMGWAKEVGQAKPYVADSIPWCGLFMAVVAKRAGKPVPDKPLWALNWAKWGEPAGQPQLGDVLTFVRDGGGHVAIYLAEDRAFYTVIGGNQLDSVCVTKIRKGRLYAARRFYAVGAPASARPIMLAVTGMITENEV